jgi:all-trans-retinol 13,14-reductase
MKQVILKYMVMAVVGVSIVTFLGYFNSKKAHAAVDISAVNNWQAVCDPRRPKSHNEYDAIVVGAGIGGLTTAALLAKNHYKVLVLEQHSQVGGYCSSYKRDGFMFTVGVENVSGFWEEGMLQKLLDTLGLHKDDLFVLNKHTCIIGGKTITFSGLKNDSIEQLSKYFPHESAAIAQFFDQAEQAMRESRSADKDSLPESSAFKSWSNATYQQKLDEYFTDTELKTVLCSLLGYIGTKPDKTPALAALKAALSYFIFGGYYPKGGPGNFAEKLQQVIETNGGTVIPNSKVDQILVESGEVIGIRVGENIYKSSVVVSNVNAKILFSTLLSKEAIDQKFVDAIMSLKMAHSTSLVNFGLDLDISTISSSSLISDHDHGVTLSIPSNVDASLAPLGKSVLSVFVASEYATTPEYGTTAYEAYKKEKLEKAIQKVETIIPDFRKHIIVSDVSTPRSFERFTAMPQGALYGFDQSAGAKRPYFKTPIRGLYLASSSTYPGGGVEAVVAAGFICFGDICSGMKK